MSIHNKNLKNVADEVMKIMQGANKPQIISEAKSGYELYHTQYSGAVQHALEHHGKKGLTADSDDYHQKVATGPRKPSEGKTVSHNIAATDKAGAHHMIHMQIYNKGGDKPYELNTYSSKVPKKQVREDVEQNISEAAVPSKEKVVTVRHKVSGKELRVVANAAEKYKNMGYEQVKEEVEQLEEMPGANMDTRAVHQHLKKKGWKLTRTSGSHDVFTHPEAKHHIPVPRHNQLKAPLVRGILKQANVNEDVQTSGELDEVAFSGSHQGKTTLKHIKNPSVGLRMAAHDIKPGIAGYRDRAALLKAGGVKDTRGPKGVTQEEIEQIDELSKDTAYSYQNKAEKDLTAKNRDLGSQIKANNPKAANKTANTIQKRMAGLDRAETRLNKEEIEQIDELSKATLSSYANKATDSARTMPGYGTAEENSKKTKRMAAIAQAASKLAKEGVEHTVPKTAKEKSLAALAHPKDKITHADVLTGRGVIKKEDMKEAKISTAQMGHQGKTTIKHIENPGVQLRMAAHDIKPGIAGYRDRIALLKAAKAQGKLKENEEQVVEEGKDEKIAQLKKDHETAVHWSKNETSPQKREAARQKAEKIKRHLNTQYKQVVAEDKEDKLANKELEEGFPTVADARARAEKEKTTGKFTSKVISTGTVYAKKHSAADAEHTEEKPKKPKTKMKMSEMVDAYLENGLKSLQESMQLQEEVDSDQFKKELEVHKKKDRGEIRNDKGVAAASTQGTKDVSEDYEVIDANEINGVSMVTIDEKTLTEPEMKKKEEVVKSMKKKVSGFKDRYGDRAKEVMYATATKIAKEKA